MSPGVSFEALWSGQEFELTEEELDLCPYAARFYAWAQELIADVSGANVRGGGQRGKASSRSTAMWPSTSRCPNSTRTMWVTAGAISVSFKS